MVEDNEERERHYALLLIALALLVLSYPVVEGLLPQERFGLAFPVLVMLASIGAVGDRQPTRVALGLLLLGAVVPALLEDEVPVWLQAAGEVCSSAFYAGMAGLLVFDVFQRRAVDMQSLYGSACVYLLVGAMFGSLYQLLETLSPGSLWIPETARGPEGDVGGTLYAYFSFVTLTTLGFGEVLPLSMPARSFAALEAVTGVLFSAILVGRLVGLHASGERAVPFAPAGAGRWSVQRPSLELLFLLVLVQLLSHPYVPFWFTRLLGVAVLLAALWALGRRPRRLVAGGLLVIPSLLRFAGLEPSGALAVAGTLAATLFLGFVTVTLILDVMSRNRVDREVVFGASCAYLLLGVTFAEAMGLSYHLDPTSLSLEAGLAPSAVYAEGLYLSFVTLTTLGYGDVLPLNGLSQSLVALEAVLGVLFPAILLARLVALYGVSPSGDAAREGEAS